MSVPTAFSCPFLSLPRDLEQVPLHSVLEITKKVQMFYKYLTKDPFCPPWTNFCMNISVTWCFFHQNTCLCQWSHYIDILKNIQMSSLFHVCVYECTSTQTCHKRTDSVFTLVSSLELINISRRVLCLSLFKSTIIYRMQETGSCWWSSQRLTGSELQWLVWFKEVSLPGMVPSIRIFQLFWF